MTVRCELYDAGTTLVKAPHESPPGMDQAYYRELDMEYNVTNSDVRPPEIAAAIRAVQPRIDLAPWPAPFPNVMWVDYTPRYYGPMGGLQVDLFHYDTILQNGDNPVPVPTCQMSDPDDHKPVIDRGYERAGDFLTMEEIQSREESPTRWLRLPTKNETGLCDLLQPATLYGRALSGSSYLAEGNYSPLFMPFDLRHPEYYRMVLDDGTPVSGDRKAALMRLMDGGYYRLYLVPAKWRWVATVVVYYIYVSWFEYLINRQIFTIAFWNRPPVYPIRHNVLTTKLYPELEYNHTFYCSDAGVNSGFDRSRGSRTLRQWIIDAQWYTLSEAYIFYSNDPVTLALWQYPPERGDVVLGIGRVDPSTRSEERLWLIQDTDVSSRWPNTLIEQYLVPFFVTV